MILYRLIITYLLMMNVFVCLAWTIRIKINDVPIKNNNCYYLRD